MTSNFCNKNADIARLMNTKLNLFKKQPISFRVRIKMTKKSPIKMSCLKICKVPLLMWKKVAKLPISSSISFEANVFAYFKG